MTTKKMGWHSQCQPILLLRVTSREQLPALSTPSKRGEKGGIMPSSTIPATCHDVNLECTAGQIQGPPHSRPSAEQQHDSPSRGRCAAATPSHCILPTIGTPDLTGSVIPHRHLSGSGPTYCCSLVGQPPVIPDPLICWQVGPPHHSPIAQSLHIRRCHPPGLICPG